MSEKEFKAERQRMEAEVDLLSIPEEEQALNAGDYFRNLATVWDKATEDERQEIIRYLFE